MTGLRLRLCLLGNSEIHCILGLVVEQLGCALDFVGPVAEIDDMGGAVAAIEKGFIQRQIASRAYKIQKEIEQKQRVVVGVNEYGIKENLDFSISKPDPSHARKQIVRLKELKNTRDRKRLQSTLGAVREAARGEENLMPRFIEAVKAYATIGEICGVLREVFGEYQQDQTIR